MTIKLNFLTTYNLLTSEEKTFNFFSSAQSSVDLIDRMTSLLSGITLKAGSKNPGKQANDVKKVPNEGVKVSDKMQKETKQLSKTLDKSVKEEKRLTNASDVKHLNIKDVTKQLFVENKEQSDEKHILGKQTNKYLAVETKQFTNKSVDLKSPQQQNPKKRGYCRSCVVCDEMVDVGKTMEKHLTAKHSEQLKSIPMSNDMGECVRTKCVICDKIFVIQRMRAHVKAAHGITMVDYRRDNLAGKNG